jgi:hypothetical protein
VACRSLPNRCQSAALMPCDGVVETIVAPEQLGAHRECRRAEDPQFSCFCRRGLVGCPHIGICSKLKDPSRILPDLAQAVRQIGRDPRFETVLKPPAERCPRVIGDPAFRNAQHRDATSHCDSG